VVFDFFFSESLKISTKYSIQNLAQIRGHFTVLLYSFSVLPNCLHTKIKTQSPKPENHVKNKLSQWNRRLSLALYTQFSMVNHTVRQTLHTVLYIRHNEISLALV